MAMIGAIDAKGPSSGRCRRVEGQGCRTCDAADSRPQANRRALRARPGEERSRDRAIYILFSFNSACCLHGQRRNAAAASSRNRRAVPQPPRQRRTRCPPCGRQQRPESQPQPSIAGSARAARRCRMAPGWDGWLPWPTQGGRVLPVPAGAPAPSRSAPQRAQRLARIRVRRRVPCCACRRPLRSRPRLLPCYTLGSRHPAPRCAAAPGTRGARCAPPASKRRG